MTRRSVYSAALAALVVATILTITSITKPDWISWNSEDSSGTPIHYTYGLHRRCSSLTGTCESFPKFEDCQRDRTFCSMWRSVGFLMSFAVVVEFASVIVCLLIIGGGKQKRDNGWKVLCSVLTVTALAQCASMAIVAYLYDHDGRFFVGWKLDMSWIFCTISWSILMVSSLGVLLAAILLPEEGGYELIPSVG